jgi:hypothetical protein
MPPVRLSTPCDRIPVFSTGRPEVIKSPEEHEGGSLFH